jgi:hypothetical protein
MPPTSDLTTLDHHGIVVGKGWRKVFVPLLVVVWFAVLTGGFYALIDFDLQPTAHGRPQRNWPAGASIERATQGPTLVVFLHPRCACSQATVSELARVLEQAQRKVETYVYFVRPPGTPADWEQGQLWRATSKIPGVHILVDTDGIQAARFGAESSGQAMLYDAAGQLTFAGGLTASRGHYGSNPSSNQLITTINSDHQALASVDVFGCPLTGLSRPAAPESQP